MTPLGERRSPATSKVPIRDREWISVTTGFFGSHRSLVQLSEAIDDGGDLWIPYGQEQVKALPTTIQIANSLRKRSGPLPALRDERRNTCAGRGAWRQARSYR